MTSEFDLIDRYFKRPVEASLLGGGDDCALFSVAAGKRIATSTDLLLEGRHFFADVDPRALGHKSLAVNLSDLAAMGARPIACLLGIALARVSEPWVSAFAEGFYAIADRYNCPLVGGDTTRSLRDITLSVTVFGEVDDALALRRSGARMGDDIWVSGELGAADVAYRILGGELIADDRTLVETRIALEQPEPRIDLGLALLGHANAAIDVSDGLLQDLGHILKASDKGALLYEADLPLHPAVEPLASQVRRRAALAGGDLYELCFTAATSERNAIRKIGESLNLRLTRIGEITEQSVLSVQDAQGRLIADLPDSYDHFKGIA